VRKYAVVLAFLLVASGCSLKGNVFSLSVGDCFNSPPTGEVDSVDRVSCSDSHKFEVYGMFDLTGSSWPGESTVKARAADGCLSRFASYVGVGYDDSDWYYSVLTPTQDSWNRGDDREVVCMLTPWSGMTTGSAKGTKR
jgi:hypothetical protein